LGARAKLWAHKRVFVSPVKTFLPQESAQWKQVGRSCERKRAHKDNWSNKWSFVPHMWSKIIEGGPISWLANWSGRVSAQTEHYARIGRHMWEKVI
jgi:hypothetical protein